MSMLELDKGLHFSPFSLLYIFPHYSTFQKTGLKISEFQFLFFSLLTMASLSLRTNLLIFLIHIFSIVITFSLNYWTVLVSLLNILKLKISISTDLKVSSTLLPSIFLHLEDRYYNPRICGNTWASSLIGNFLSTNTSTITPTKQCQQSSV